MEGIIIMKRSICLPNVESVTEFVRATESNSCHVTVTKNGCSYGVDGRSIVGMMVFVGDRLQVDIDDCSDELIHMLNKYAIEEKTSA